MTLVSYYGKPGSPRDCTGGGDTKRSETAPYCTAPWYDTSAPRMTGHQMITSTVLVRYSSTVRVPYGGVSSTARPGSPEGLLSDSYIIELPPTRTTVGILPVGTVLYCTVLYSTVVILFGLRSNHYCRCNVYSLEATVVRYSTVGTRTFYSTVGLPYVLGTRTVQYYYCCRGGRHVSSSAPRKHGYRTYRTVLYSGLRNPRRATRTVR